MEIYLHIGSHKTGTTTIQRALHLNRKTLRRQGFFLPCSGRPNPHFAAQHNLCWEIRSDRRFDPQFGTWNDLTNEIDKQNNYEKILLSSEDFCLLSLEQILQVRQKLANHQAKIILYLRRQDKLLQSIWSQTIKSPTNPFKKAFSTFIQANLDTPHRINYERIIADWGAVFGHENLILRVLEKESLSGHLFHDFLNACGVPDAENYSLPKNVNESPGPKTIRLLYDIKTNWGKGNHRDPLIYLFALVNAFAEHAGWNDQRLNLVDQQIFDGISALYADSNAQIARRFFQRDALFLEPFRASRLTPLENYALSEAEWRALLNWLPIRALVRPSLAKAILNARGDDKKIRLLIDAFRKINIHYLKWVSRLLIKLGKK